MPSPVGSFYFQAKLSTEVVVFIHPLVATSLNNEDYDKAEPLYQRAVAIWEKSLGPDHPDVAEPLNNLAILYSDKGDYAKAEPLFQRVLTIYEKSLGPDVPLVATSLNNLASLYRDKGDYAKAEPLYQRALAISEKALGADHPNVADSLNNIALLYSDKGEHAKAVESLSRAVIVSERNITANLNTGSERQKLLYLSTLSEQTNNVISLHAQSSPANAPALSLAIEQVNAPSILHVATHGFFLEDVVTRSSMRVENPLLRSGLALAGANLHKSDGDNGILTALEVSGLNLWGTKLVVLSACETGVGEVKTGNGIFGLRRALVLAGSESQMLSLWKVDDNATRDLMIDYYTLLKAGFGRSEALRQVQLKMMVSRRYQHPYFWASFIESGEWANLEGKR